MKRDELARLLESVIGLSSIIILAQFTRCVYVHYYERKRVQSSRGMFRDKITLRPSLINWRCFRRRWFVDTEINFFCRYFVWHKRVRGKK